MTFEKPAECLVLSPVSLTVVESPKIKDLLNFSPVQSDRKFSHISVFNKYSIPKSRWSL